MLTGLHGKLIFVWSCLACELSFYNASSIIWIKVLWYEHGRSQSEFSSQVMHFVELLFVLMGKRRYTSLSFKKKNDCVWKIFAVHETHISHRVLRDFCWSAALSSTFAFCIINSRRANEVKETCRWYCLDLCDGGNHSPDIMLPVMLAIICLI